MIRFTVGLFAFTLFFAAGVKARSDDRILHAGGTVAVFLGIGSMMTFLFLIDYTARLLRPRHRLADRRARHQGHRKRLRRDDRPAAFPQAHAPAAGTAGARRRAFRQVRRRAGGQSVGDFVTAGEPLFHLYGGAAALDDHRLRTQVAFGWRRIPHPPSIEFY